MWKIRSSRVVVQDKWIHLVAENCVTDNGYVLDPYYKLIYPDWVHIIAVNQEGKVCIVEQYRHGASRRLKELPCGAVSGSETALEAAQRELLEETGLRGVGWRLLGQFYPNPANQTNSVYVVGCSVFESPDVRREAEGEETLPEMVQVSTIMTLIDQGIFGQIMHIGSFFRALQTGFLLNTEAEISDDHGK